METQAPRLIDLIDDLCAGKDVFFRLVRVAGDVMTRRLKALTLDDTIEDALQFIREHNVRHIPLVDAPIGDERAPCFVGIVSERDVFRQISPFAGKLGETEEENRHVNVRVDKPVCQCLPEYLGHFGAPLA